MGTIPFTSNHQDLSSDRGFQFKFFCEKCGNGYMSTFRANQLGTAASIARGAAGLLGGIFGRAAQTADSIRNITAGPQRDSALRDAVEEIRPLFKQCSRCGRWVCEPVCWNKQAGLCETCAPDMNEEIAAAQAVEAKSQVAEKVKQVDFVGARNLGQVSAVTCPHCGVKSAGGKFCTECGGSLNPKQKCAKCGAESDGTTKFCPECGTPRG